MSRFAPFIGIGIVLCIVGAVSLFPDNGKTGVVFQEILLTEEGFEPREAYVRPGGTVLFSANHERSFWPASNLHPQHDIYPAFDPKRALGPGEMWSFTFTEAGTYGYHDHLRAYFNGVIYVE